MPYEKISEEEMEEIRKEENRILLELQEEESGFPPKPKKETIGTCRCKGKVVILTTYTSDYDPSTGPLIMGPGSRGQFKNVENTECFCEGCGIVYKPEVVKNKKS